MRPRRATLWRSPDFVKLWTGQAISQIGSRITREGLPFAAVMVLGASPLEMGILNGGAAAAVLVCGLFAGAWADRLRRRPLMIAADVGRAALLASVPIAAVLGRLAMGQLYVVAALAAVLTVLFDVSYQAYVPGLVGRDNLVEANSKLALSESVAEVAGPGLTGVLVQLLTAPKAIAFDALSFAVSAISVGWVRRPEPPPPPAEHPHMLREIAEGLRVCGRNPILRAMLLRSSAGLFFAGFYASLYTLFAVRTLGLNAAALGAIVSVGGAASLAGALVSERLVRRLGIGRALIGAGIVLGLTSLLVPLAHGSVLASAAFLMAAQLGDFAWPITNVAEISLRQSASPAHLLARVNSAVLLAVRAAVPAGALAGGALAGHIGVRHTMMVGGAGFLLSTVFLVVSPVRSVKDPGAPGGPW